MLLPRPPLERPPRPRDPDGNDTSRPGAPRPLPPEYASNTISVPRVAAAVAVPNGEGIRTPARGNFFLFSRSYTVPAPLFKLYFRLH